MKKVSADKFNQIKSRYKFIKLDIELDASKDIVFYGCEISDKRVLVVGVFNSDIATCAYVTRGEIIECNGKYIIDADELCKCNAHHFADAVMDVPQINEMPDALSDREIEEESNNVNDSRLGAIDAVNYGEPAIPNYEIPNLKVKNLKENKPVNKVEDLIANVPTKVQVEVPPKTPQPPKVTPVMTRGRAFEGELKTPQSEPKRESAIFKKNPVETKPEPQRNKNPQTAYKAPEKKVVSQTSDDDWGSWG